ncbi:uncharacterized protein LOC102671714 [Apis dorsata]|uniref:uncharacterized protein LOC102671714 n=1 Tax=Apis dorsata TaxID=7462 RepID=UPI0003DF66EF|nr:uncharacterized protein LOC102671714 [Apis dorsata]
MLFSVYAESSSIQNVKPTNILGTSDQHASFSFIRPGLIQTAFAFNGPNSHQSFSSNIGNLQLAQRVLPNIANALAYKSPSLGVFPIAHGYATAPTFVSSAPTSLPYQASVDPFNALAYYQQLQQFQQPHIHGYSPANAYQTQLAQLFALRQAQAQTQSQENVQATQSHTQVHPEQIQLQQEQQQQSQNLLGVAYSSAPSVARVKVSGNGYKFDF